MKDEPLGFDPEKKRQRDRDRDIASARSRVGDIYSGWQQRLCKRARSRREIIQSFYDLQKSLDEKERECGQLAPEVFAWDVTRKLIESKIAYLTAIQICADNTAIQHVPVTMLMRTDGQVAEPRKDKFRTIKEFNEIEFVKHFSEQAGFRGFFAKMSMEDKEIKYFIIAQYETDAVLVCELFNDVCLDDFLSYDDLDEPTKSWAAQPPVTTPPTATAGEPRPASPTGDNGTDGGDSTSVAGEPS